MFAKTVMTPINPLQEFVLTDFNRDIETNADLEVLDPRDTIWVRGQEDEGPSKVGWLGTPVSD